MIEKTSFVAMFDETMELWTNSQLSCILLSVGKKGKHLERILGNMSMSVNIEEVHCWWKKIENLLMNSTLSKNSLHKLMLEQERTKEIFRRNISFVHCYAIHIFRHFSTSFKYSLMSIFLLSFKMNANFFLSKSNVQITLSYKITARKFPVLPETRWNYSSRHVTIFSK